MSFYLNKLGGKMYIGYKTVCIVNGKQYIGVHKTDDLNDSYIGNGITHQPNTHKRNTLFGKAVKKHGYHNFKREIIKVFDTPEEAYEWEKSIVTVDFLNRDDVYNTRVGGEFGSNIWTEKRKAHHRENKTYAKSNEQKHRISVATKKRFETQPGTFTGKRHADELLQRWSEERTGIPNGRKGLKLTLSDEQRLTISNRTKATALTRKQQGLSFGKPKRFTDTIIKQIREEYTGMRGDKQKLALKYECSISLITSIVGKSFTHKGK